jgi:hypothetical protein
MTPILYEQKARQPSPGGSAKFVPVFVAIELESSPKFDIFKATRFSRNTPENSYFTVFRIDT